MTPCDISMVIAQVESSGNPLALRFEPSVFARLGNISNVPVINQTLQNITHACNCSLDTAKMIYSSSWGMFQIMGFNLYDTPIAYKKNIIEFASNVDHIQQDTFLQFIQFRFGWQQADVSTWNDAKFEEFALLYNGPGNVAEYAAKMKQAYTRITGDKLTNATS